MSRFEIEYETADSWWWGATEPTLDAAKDRLAQLSARFPTRQWRIKKDGEVLDGEGDAPLPGHDDFADWLSKNPEPSLADLIRAHGGHSAIPASAWREFDQRMAIWQRRRRGRYGGAITSS